MDVILVGGVFTPAVSLQRGLHNFIPQSPSSLYIQEHARYVGGNQCSLAWICRLSQLQWKRTTNSTSCTCGATIRECCSAVEMWFMSSPADQRPVMDARRVTATVRNMMAEVESGVDALSTFPGGQQGQVFLDSGTSVAYT